MQDDRIIILLDAILFRRDFYFDVMLLAVARCGIEHLLPQKLRAKPTIVCLYYLHI